MNMAMQNPHQTIADGNLLHLRVVQKKSTANMLGTPKDRQNIWVFPKIVVPQNGWFIRENPLKMDDLGGNTPIFGNTHIKQMQ